MITITNSAYKELTKNSLASLRRHNLKVNIEVFTLDDECCKDFIDLGYYTTSLSTDLSMGSRFMDKNWANVTLSKLKVIHSVLERYKYVLLVDGDIVFDKGDFLSYVYDIIKEKPSLDLVCQLEFSIDKGNKEIVDSLNSGFMLIRSNENTKKFFHPDRYRNCINDQDYLNKNKRNLKYQGLPIDLFPNGYVFYQLDEEHPYRLKAQMNSMIVHFNYIAGIQDKIDKMKELGRWFI